MFSRYFLSPRLGWDIGSALGENVVVELFSPRQPVWVGKVFFSPKTAITFSVKISFSSPAQVNLIFFL